MKQKITLMALFWLFLVYSHQAFGSPGEASLSASKSSSALLATPPGAGFTYTATSGCVPVTVQFYSQMNGPSYSWTFGDGGTSSDCNPVHTYTTPGTYTVTLVATGGTYTTTITVGANPVVSLLGNDSVSCLDETKVYNITSSIPPASYSWTAQGGTVLSSGPLTATVKWTSYGVNYLTYTITTSAGCTKVFRFKIKVIPPPTINLPCCDRKDRPESGDPKANAIPPQEEGVPGKGEPCSACAGSYNCYTGNINPEFGLASDYTWSWTVTNGTIVSISSPDSNQACVVWGPSGTGTIKLVVTHKVYGCQSVKECEVVLTPGVTPAFSVTGNCINSPVNFDAAGTTPISEVASYFWEFGDGYSTTTIDPSATHQFTFTGSYTATLTITTKAGCRYKTTRTFNVISGTKPTIECMGTVCERSRQCYSTEYIPGATYTWIINGDIVADRVITGNKVCVTWGSGPVGTVSVVVNGGGYTCTNTATESVAIVSSSIPISGPDFICQSTGYIEVSTANYSGACYKWVINGTAQAETSNKLTFNAAAYGNPIRVEVVVDFPLGCCHGRGIKEIRKIPQYTMAWYEQNRCVGDVRTYNLIFPAGVPAPPVAWDVVGGTILSSNPTSVTIRWDVPGSGTITAGNNTPSMYCNDGTNNTWTVNVWAPATGDDISGPPVVCAGSSNTYYHAWASPTSSATVTVSGGASISSSPFSSVITFPAVAVPTLFTITVTYYHSMVSPCTSTKTYTVKVMPNTVPSFSGVGGTVCEGDIVTYTASLPDNINYSWEAMGGSIIYQNYSGTTLTIQVQWNSTLTSSLKITNKICNLTSTQAVTVHGKPVVIITPSGPTCPSPSVTLRVAPVWSTYAWSGGGTSNTKTVTTTGVHSVTVSNGMCSNTGTINVPFVNPVPPTITGFTVTPTTIPVCPRINTICPVITPGSGSVTSYNWTFSGFTTTSSTAACPAVAIAGVGGTGTWTLTITDSYLCTSTRTGTLTETCIPVPGCANFVGSFNINGYNPCNGQFLTSFSNVSSVEWLFGDGSMGSGLSPVHFYNSVCTQNVTCYVTDINNCLKVFTFPINVPYAFVNPSIGVTNSPCTGASSLRALGLQICGTSGLTPSYSWVITPAAGGPAVYTSPGNPISVGSMPIPNGNYIATVTMTVAGCTRTVSVPFNKGGLQAYFVSCGGCAGAPLTFTDQSTPYTAPLIKWQWNVTGPASFSSSLQNPTILFTVPGTYNVSLTVTDNVPCTSTFTANIVIQPPFNPGNIRVNGTPTASNTTFNICPTDPYTLTAPPGGVAWAWSNGSTASSINVTEPGDYYVTVFNANNCATKVGPIKILYKPAPEAIIIAGSNPCAYRFIRAFTGTGYTYSWVTPIGSFSGQTNFYLNAPGGPVNLTVTNLYGCSDAEAQNISVLPSPNVFVSAAPTPFCPGASANLTANASGGTPGYTYQWNNGSTSPVIGPITTPGVYKVSVTDQNNCTTNTSYNLQPATPPGMDLLPRGCYDVCTDQVTFCTGRMPWGWKGQWYRDLSPYGGTIPENGNMATTFSGSGTYTLHYIPTDPSLRCAAVSNPIIINMASLPSFTISTGGSAPVICTGGSLVLTANPQNPDYTYTWYYGGSVVGAGYTHTATAPGTYVLVVSQGACCSRTVAIDIGETNCCFDGPSVPYTSILQDSNIYVSQFWGGKYYIDAVVSVYSSAVLDITNVDIVFGPNGTIRFYENSFLRCNNSVLRPCGKDDIWQGISFHQEASGWINTTTIKNAIIGVMIDDNRAGVRMTDNSFLKCQIGVRITKSEKQQSISGNTFEIDPTQLPYKNNPNEYWAIKIIDARMEGMIAQNSIRHAQPGKSGNLFYGIYSELSNGTISENYFNDMYRSIDVTRNREVVAIERNQVKINYLQSNYDKYQYRITFTDIPVLVHENIMDNGLGDQTYAGAIYAEQTYRTHMKDNKINGYSLGIHARHTNSLYLASNEITSSLSVGITLLNSWNSVVSCNTIKGSNSNGVYRYGIVDIDGDGSSSLFSNCIFDMNTSIYLRGNPDMNLPAIYNNYLYNYDDAGIFNQDYSGFIGLPGGPTDAGRNTFMSNNGAAGSTFDINSTIPITEDGNFGIQMTNNTSTSTGTDKWYSTASCGQQIGNDYRGNMLDKYNVCDVYFLDKWLYRTGDNQYALRKPQGNLTSDMINEAISKNQAEIFGQVVALIMDGGTAAQKAAQALLASKADRNFAALLITNSYLAIGDRQGAKNQLASAELGSIDSELRQILQITMELDEHPVMTEAQMSALKAIDDQDVKYSPIARDLIQGYVGNHDYKFEKVIVPETDKKLAKNINSKLGNTLTVYPVPAADLVTVKHNVNNGKVQELKVYSAAGMEVSSFSYTIQSGSINLDISTLASGIYSVVLITDNKTEPLMTGRFVKVK